jgi:uncharacterized Zn-binding protein involved in type VI secretion
MSKGIARVANDIADTNIQSGATSIISNNFVTAHEGSIMSSGSSIAQGSRTVFVENKPVARQSDLTNNGEALRTGSENIIVGG